MSKKMFSKVIAMVCVAALCLTAVFTGAVSADTRSATCTVKGYGYDEGAHDTYVTYEVTITSTGSDNAFVAGTFDVVVPEGFTFIDCSLAGSDSQGTPRVYLNVGNGKVLFAGFSETNTNDINSMNSITFILKCTPDTPIEEMYAGEYYEPVQITNISLTNAAEEGFTCANVTTNSPNAHIHNFSGAGETVGGINTKTCSFSGCGAKHTEVVTPSAIDPTPNSLADTRAAVVSFTNDGDTVLNALLPKTAIDGIYSKVYFVYSYYTDASTESGGLVNATVEWDPTNIINYSDTDYYAFPCKRNGGIGRMSRDISGNFFAVTSGNQVSESALWEYSIADYANWLSTYGTTNEQNYAKALWNYGYYTTLMLRNGNNQTGVVAQESFVQDLEYYTNIEQNGYKTCTEGYELPADKSARQEGLDGWSIGGVKVTTGFKPKITFRVDSGANRQKTFEIKDVNGNTLYKKTLGPDNQLVLSDVPTKYLVNEIEITDETNAGKFTYSYGRYAKARSEKTDANVFKWMMQYAYYLGMAFPY